MIKQASWLEFTPGDIVTFLNEYMFDKNNIIVSGMLGEVYPDYSGIASYENGVMVIPLGASAPFSYPSRMVLGLDSPPREDLIKMAFALYEYRFEVFEARVGWTGYVKIKNHIIEEKRIKSELQNTARVVLRELENNKEAKVYKGHIKRIKSILNSFQMHPFPEEPLQLAQALTESRLNTSVVAQTLKQALSWSLQPTVPPCTWNNSNNYQFPQLSTQ
jgi:hypothetical protein